MPTPTPSEKLPAACEVCHAFTKRPHLIEDIEWLGRHLPELEFVRATGRAVTCEKCMELIERLGEAEDYTCMHLALHSLLRRRRKYAVDD